MIEGSDPTPTDPSRFLNRELSWLEFNARVLALAEDDDLPLLERAKFLAIFTQNLDEFFQVRVSGLEEQVAAGIRTKSADGLEPADQVRAVRRQIGELVTRHATIFAKEVTPALADAGITFVGWEDLHDDDRRDLARVFESDMFPILTPLAVDPAHPFPYISNLSLNLAVIVRDPATRTDRFARVKVPPVLARFVRVDGEALRFIPVEQVIAAHLDRLFPGMEIVAQYPFRVTRDADFELDDEDEDLLEAIESVLHRRSKFGRVVRLEIDPAVPPSVRDLLCRELELDPGSVDALDGPLDLGGLWGIYTLDRPELKDTPWVPVTPPPLAPRVDEDLDLFEVLDQGDVLVHHPYDSFAASVEAFIEQAATDPRVLAIKQTIYRGAGPDSAIVRALIRAAKLGKQVVALVELKARFDEQANIERARALEEAGVHVVYGLVGLKTHAKILLVLRQEAGGIRRYCHVGTGNYNPQTANFYEDLGILSADPDLGSDLAELFNHLTGYSRAIGYRKILVAPEALRDALATLIRAEAARGPDGLIRMKMNSLVDPLLIDELYAASRCGTPIDLIVRGICCLRPRVSGLSDTIRVRSIIGRFLEHSRVYRFGADADAAAWFIGSADLMPRNLDGRVEVLAPVTDPKLRARLEEIIRIELGPDVISWELDADGVWHRALDAGTDAQREMQALALVRTQVARVTLETEFKFLADPEFRMPDLTRAGVMPSAVEVVDDVGTYYDTNDFRLTRAGLSLRYRTSDGWTVKLPHAARPATDSLVRHEHRFPGGPAVPPLQAIDLVQSHTRSARLVPALELVVRRERRFLTAPDGTEIGELVDDLVRAGTGEHPTLPFRELEFELAADAPAALVGAVLGWLRAAGARAVPARSKISRALGPRAQGASDLEPLVVGPDPDLLAVVRVALTNPVLAMLEHDPGVRLGVDPEAVHQARVATRRLRSNLRTFRPVLARAWAEDLRGRLALVAAALGEVRDADVLGARLRAHAARLDRGDRTAVEEIVRELDGGRAAVLRTLVVELRGPTYLTLLDDLVDAARHPHLAVDAETPAPLALLPLVRRPWRILRNAVRALPAVPPDEDLHAARILAKRARYAADAVTPAFGEPATTFARAMARVQEHLGEHQDAVVAAAWLRRFGTSTTRPDLAFAAGELAEAEHEIAARLRSTWPNVWSDAATRAVTRWLA